MPMSNQQQDIIEDVQAQARKETKKVWKDNLINTLKREAKTPSGWVWFWLSVGIVGSGAVLFLVLVGGIKLSSSKEKDLWIEINSQILNGIFTLIAISNLPVRIWMLVAWIRSSDSLLQSLPWCKLYRKRALLVIVLFIVQCITQVPITVVMWGFSQHTRPNIIIAIFLPISFLSGIVASILSSIFLARWKKAKQKSVSQAQNAEPNHQPNAAAGNSTSATV